MDVPSTSETSGKTYACETWVLKETTGLKLQVFERKALKVKGKVPLWGRSAVQ
jgi:hypothetical protein